MWGAVDSVKLKHDREEEAESGQVVGIVLHAVYAGNSLGKSLLLLLKNSQLIYR